ncbi:MAG: hypothetical protein LBG27_08800, partial [Spirochaetaceae bacterium]|nr:hypothetical protein [Spirochaetaceae bacterium]
LTPRADCSGKTERYGSIAGYQFCRPIRAAVLEGVWAMAGGREGAAVREIRGTAGEDGQEEKRGGGGAEDSVAGMAADEAAGILPWDE